jgi:predicted protein tyrosine phosphatase
VDDPIRKLHPLSHGPPNEHGAPTELENDQGALAAIDMALLRSFSRWFIRSHDVHPFKQRLFICGFEERAEYQSRNISHLITIANPAAALSQPSWFKGVHLRLRFGDVVSEADAKRCKTTAPCLQDLQQAVEFFRGCWVAPGSKILVSCDHGASRSPALAYVLMADQLRVGRETEAFGAVLDIRSVAVPNGLVVRLGDTLLRRNGALIAPLKDFYARLNAELFPKTV